MHPAETFELRIMIQKELGDRRAAVKQDVCDWLLGFGEESFVDGAIDDLYLDLDFDQSADDRYLHLGGDTQPLSVYKYDRDYLVKLSQELEGTFGKAIHCELTSHETDKWMEGWKESFKPIATQSFYIYPPWEQVRLSDDLHPIVIEPGMAFGTGQHATTMLCVAALEFLHGKGVDAGSVLDVGTGTGILAIAAGKLGYAPLVATDIDPDSVTAATANAQQNQVAVQVKQGSVPSDNVTYNIVLANIIFYVLKNLVFDLVIKVESGGYLILSGLLDEECREMESIASICGLSLVQESVKDGWACQIYTRKS